MNAASSQPPTGEPLGELELVATFDGAMPTGVSVSHQGRIFVNFPKWGDDVRFTVAEVRDGEQVAYPSQALNDTDEDDLAGTLVSVQSIVVDPADRLWLLDTGSPLFQPTSYGGQKLVCVDLPTDQVARTILFPQDVALPTTYLNDVRFDLTRGPEGTAYITDSSDQGPNGLIVVDLASGESWRRLHDHPSTKFQSPHDVLPMVEGRPLVGTKDDGSMEPVLEMGADGIAISADGSRIFYCPLVSRRLYSVSAEALADRSLSDDAVAATVVDEGDKGGAADRLESDAAGHVYATNYEHNAVTRRTACGRVGDRRPRPASAVARHHVGGHRRVPLRDRQPAPPAGRLPGRRGPARQALRPLPAEHQRVPGAAEVTEPRRRLAILFDIDGTLISTGGAGATSWKRAFDEVYGIPADIGEFTDTGMTDPTVGRLTFKAVLGRDPDPPEFAKLLERRLFHLRRAVDEAEGYRVMAGAEELLDALVDDGYLLGLVTGNLEAAAHIKLHRANLNRFFSFGGFGSDADDRGELTRVALQRASLVYGAPVAPGDALVVGDTPADVKGAHAAGIECVGVGSHRYDADQLREAGADYVLDSLTEGLPL